MTEGATGLEPTIELTDADYPEIMRIVASDGEVDNYLASAGVARDVFGDDTDDGTALCVPERAALGGPLLYVVEVGEVAGTSDTEGALMLPASAATSMLASVNDVANEGLRLADCLEGFQPDAAAGLRETFELLGLDGDRLRRAVEERTLAGCCLSDGRKKKTVQARKRPRHSSRISSPESPDPRSRPPTRRAAASAPSGRSPRSVSEYSTRGGTSGYDVPLDEPVGLERAQRRGEHLLADALGPRGAARPSGACHR